MKARTKIGWAKCGECQELIRGRKLLKKMKRKDLLDLYKVGNAVWKLHMMSGRE